MTTADPLQLLIQQQIQNLLSEADNSDFDFNPTGNVYFDKQLAHLVISEEFNFSNISLLLTDAFKNDKVDTSELACRERWTYLHLNRGRAQQIREQLKEDKRVRSVAAFRNPYSLYSVDELIETLETAEKNKQNHSSGEHKVEEPVNHGYNIMKDSFRKVHDHQEYAQSEAKMKEALRRAQEQVYEEKPLFFTPEYGKTEEFQVKSEELTAQKVKQLLAYQIEMEKISRELTYKNEQAEEEKYEDIIRRRVEREQKKKQGALQADIDDDWDEYQSD